MRTKQYALNQDTSWHSSVHLRALKPETLNLDSRDKKHAGNCDPDLPGSAFPEQSLRNFVHVRVGSCGEGGLQQLRPLGDGPRRVQPGIFQRQREGCEYRRMGVPTQPCRPLPSQVPIPVQAGGGARRRRRLAGGLGVCIVRAVMYIGI